MLSLSCRQAQTRECTVCHSDLNGERAHSAAICAHIFGFAKPSDALDNHICPRCGQEFAPEETETIRRDWERFLRVQERRSNQKAQKEI